MRRVDVGRPRLYPGSVSKTGGHPRRETLGRAWRYRSIVYVDNRNAAPGALPALAGRRPVATTGPRRRLCNRPGPSLLALSWRAFPDRRRPRTPARLPHELPREFARVRAFPDALRQLVSQSGLAPSGEYEK